MNGFICAVTRLPTRLIGLWALLLLAFAPCGWALTASGIVITNQASVDYTMGASPVFTIPSNLVQFAVDKKIDLLVSHATGLLTSVNAAQVDAVTTFTVTNLGNDAQGFSLLSAIATGDPAVGGGAPFTANDFNATNLRVFVDSNNNGTYEPLLDMATSLPTLAAGATSPIIFIVSDIPASLSGQQSVVGLTATVIPLIGDPVLPTPAAALAVIDTPNGVEVVYADIAGVTDGTRNGQHSAYGGYLAGAAVQISKTIVRVQPTIGSTVLSPVNSGDPALRPGSIITYRVVASFVGTGTLDNLTITDPLPADTQYIANSITVDGIAKTDLADADNANFTANLITVARGSVTTTVAAPAADIVIEFQATIK
ncbi:MAG: hypothetical protein ABL902_03440 [Gallionella sp.]|nr:hypothetical protein [Gallionella sp.]